MGGEVAWIAGSVHGRSAKIRFGPHVHARDPVPECHWPWRGRRGRPDDSKVQGKWAEMHQRYLGLQVNEPSSVYGCPWIIQSSNNPSALNFGRVGLIDLDRSGNGEDRSKTTFHSQISIPIDNWG